MLAQNERSTTPLHVVSQAASTSPDGQPPGPNTVKAGLTSRRPRRLVENDEYGAFAACPMPAASGTATWRPWP